MSRVCYHKDLPKPCQMCRYLHCAQPYMDGKGAYYCMSKDIEAHFIFNKGVYCKRNSPIGEQILEILDNDMSDLDTKSGGVYEDTDQRLISLTVEQVQWLTDLLTERVKNENC